MLAVLEHPGQCKNDGVGARPWYGAILGCEIISTLSRLFGDITSAASPPTLANSARMGHPLLYQAKNIDFGTLSV
jgi:hypothetical protein